MTKLEEQEYSNKIHESALEVVDPTTYFYEKMHNEIITLTLKVLVTTIDTLRHL